MPRTKVNSESPKTDSLALTAARIEQELTSSPWFQRQLSDEEKKQVLADSEALAHDLQTFGHSRIAVAARLSRIQDVLGPLKLFEKFLKQFHFKRRSAYRAIKSFRNAQALPQPIINAAMARNVNIMGETESAPFGTYTDAIKKLPPPPAPSEAQAVEYLDKLEGVKRGLPKPERPADPVQEVLGPTDPKDLMREVYRFADVRYRRLPVEMTHRAKSAWVKTLCGMLLQRTGLSGEPAIAIIAPPPDFKAVRGRPKVH